MNPDEVLSFLARAWSEDKNVRIYRAYWFYAHPETKIIHLPSYLERIPNEKELNLYDVRRWRFFRFSAWHEAQHIRFSPDRKDIFESARDMLLSSKPTYISYIRKEKLLMNLIDIFEDYRIEKLGLRDYKYEEEKEFMKEIGRRGTEIALANIPSLASTLNLLTDNSIRALRLTNLMIGILLFDYKPKRQTKWTRRLLKVKKIMEKIETVDDLINSVILAYNILEDLWVEPIGAFSIEEIKYTVLPQTLETGKEIKIEAPQFILSEFEEVKKYIKKYEEQMQVMEASAGLFGGSVQRQRGDWEEIYSPVKAQAEILKTNLMKWKVGWVEALGHVGDDIEPESYLLSRHYRSYERPKFFIDERKLRPEGKFLFLVDMSASTEGYNEMYRQALAIITSALDYIGIEFSIISFSGQALSLIKDLHIPFDLNAKERIAGLESEGGTPLGYILRKLSPYMVNIDRLVVMTDGMPGDTYLSLKMINEYRNSGKKVGVLLLSKSLRVLEVPFVEELTRIPNIFTFTQEISELPIQFFKLLEYMK